MEERNINKVDWLLVRAFQKKENISDIKLSSVLGINTRTLRNWRENDNFLIQHKDEFNVIAKIFRQEPDALIKGSEQNRQLWTQQIDYLRNNNLMISRNARTNNASYNGVIVEIQPDYAIQRWEDNGKVHGYVKHLGDNLISGCSNIKINTAVNIRYKDGKGTVSQLEKTESKEIER